MTPTPKFSSYDFCVVQAHFDKKIKSLSAEILSAHKLTHMEWLVMCVINSSPRASKMSDIANEIGVSLPQITALVTNLISKRLIKQKTIISDRRSKHLSLTLKGKRIMGKVETTLNKNLKSWLTEIPHDEFSQFYKNLKLLSGFNVHNQDKNLK